MLKRKKENGENQSAIFLLSHRLKQEQLTDSLKLLAKANRQNYLEGADDDNV